MWMDETEGKRMDEKWKGDIYLHSKFSVKKCTNDALVGQVEFPHFALAYASLCSLLLSFACSFVDSKRSGFHQELRTSVLELHVRVCVWRKKVSVALLSIPCGSEVLPAAPLTPKTLAIDQYWMKTAWRCWRSVLERKEFPPLTNIRCRLSHVCST